MTLAMKRISATVSKFNIFSLQCIMYLWIRHVAHSSGPTMQLLWVLCVTLNLTVARSVTVQTTLSVFYSLRSFSIFSLLTLYLYLFSIFKSSVIKISIKKVVFLIYIYIYIYYLVKYQLNIKVEYYIKIKIHKFIDLSFGMKVISMSYVIEFRLVSVIFSYVNLTCGIRING